MFNVLNRFAIVLSVIVGFLVAYFLCGFDSRPTETFFEGGWVVFIIATALARATFLSRAFVESALSEVSRQPAVESLRSDDARPAVSVAAPSVAPVSQTEDVARPAPAPAAPSVPSEPDKPNAIVEFFSDRPLAKIGGILLFLGAVFFLSLVWQEVGPVGKILIGLAFGFALYGI